MGAVIRRVVSLSKYALRPYQGNHEVRRRCIGQSTSNGPELPRSSSKLSRWSQFQAPKNRR